jgi:hypothetical protein
MSIIFSASDLETLMIKVLFENTKWFNKSELYNETKKYFTTNKSELTMCHFLFSWEKLLANTNFIIVKESNNSEQIKISINTSLSNEFNTEKTLESSKLDNDINFTIDVKDTILHMCNNKTIYFKSKVLQIFFKKNFPQYNSVYELLISNRQEIGYDNIMCFIDLYSDNLETDKIINFITNKKYFKNKKETIQTSNYTNSNFIYNLIFRASFASIIGFLMYRNTYIFKYFKLFRNK